MPAHPPSIAAYDVLLAQCAPFGLPPPWDCLGPDTDCRAAVTDPDQVLAALRRAVPVEHLRQARLIVEAPSSLRLAPHLCAAAPAARRGGMGAYTQALGERLFPRRAAALVGVRSHPGTP